MFLENERWIAAIKKFEIIVQGDPKNPQKIEKDSALKEKLSDQIHPDTYEDRKAYFEAWVNAKCCADDCGKYCDECEKHGISFKPLPYRLSKEFDPDVRRFMEKSTHFWLKSEQDKAVKYMVGGTFYADGREVADQADGNDVIRSGQRKGIRQPGGGQKDSGDSYQDQ